MHSPLTFVTPEMAFASFDLVSFGSIRVPPHPLRLGFQLDIIPSECPNQIIFGLISQHRPQVNGRFQTHGFAIRLNLLTGEIWDMLNDSGLIGMVEEPDTFQTRYTDEEPMLMSWEVEHLGSALIPRLQIAGEQWLYPALSNPDNLIMDTLAGAAGDKGGTMTAFMHPAVWLEVI
jgi:hypothetical protein